MRTNKFVISDIHGCSKTLDKLLNKIGFTKDDNLYLLGDYINRGPNSKGVIDQIMNLKEEHYNITTLWGNHEQMLFDEVVNHDRPLGIPETLKSFGVKYNNEIPDKYIKWLEKLEFYTEVDNFILVHAGLNFHFDNPLEDEYDLLWVRDWYKYIDEEWLEERVIIHGHTPLQRNAIELMLASYQKNQVINIDNGCVYDEEGLKHLCCLNLATMELIFQKNIDGFYRD